MKIKTQFLVPVSALILCFAATMLLKAADHPEATPKVSPSDALALLKDGNQRFVASKLTHPHQPACDRRDELATGQHPFRHRAGLRGLPHVSRGGV